MQILLENKFFHFFIFLILILIPNIYLFHYLQEIGISIFINNLLLILVILLFSKRNTTKIISIFFLVVFVLNNGLLVFNLVFYKEKFNVVTALSFFTTNSREALEMIGAFWYVLFLGVIYFLCMYINIMKFLSNKINTNLLLLCVSALIIYPAYLSYTSFHANPNNKIDNISSYTKYRILLGSPFFNVAPFYSAYEYLKSVNELDKKDFNYPIFNLKENNIENIVVVIGESARKDALHLYGNNVLTTPEIDKRINNLLIYDNAIAPSSLTNTAVTLMLSKQLPSNDFSITKNNDNIISLANATNIWQTYWISTQEKVGVFANMYSTINRNALNQYWVNNPQYDFEVLHYFKKSISDKNKKRLIFIHIKGSHTTVSKRYPSTYNRFQNDKRQFVNEYNNSILYTDYVLDEIIKQVENTKSIVIYVSDHGQSIVEGGYKHSFTKKGVDVPFFIWHSNSVDKSLKKVGRIEEPISTTNLYNIVSDYMNIIGLEPKDSNKELKILNSSIDITYYKDLPAGE